MLQFPDFNPIAVSIGPFEILDKTIGPLNVHWYGIMYMLAFLSAWLLAVYRSKKPWSPITKFEVENLITYGAFGVILGGRFGYVIFIILTVGWATRCGYSAYGKAECRSMAVCSV